MLLNSSATLLTVGLADDLGDGIGGAEGDELIVLVELAEGHAQAVVGEDQEDLVQQVGQVLQLQLWRERRGWRVEENACTLGWTLTDCQC